MSVLDKPIVFTLRMVLRSSLVVYGVVLLIGLGSHLLPGPRDHGPWMHALGLVGVAYWWCILAEPREPGEQ